MKKTKPVEEAIAEIRAIADRVNQMRLAAPADDPLQGACFKIVALCGKVEAWIRLDQRRQSEI
jgi:hypothetical protein